MFSAIMKSDELKLLHEIENIFMIKKEAIIDFKNIGGSNLVYSFIINNEKYVIKKLNETSIIDWRQEKAAYDALKTFDITDELVFFDNGIKVSKYLNDSKTLSYSKQDMIESLNLIRKVHDSGVKIEYNYDIIANLNKYISYCNKNSKKLKKIYESKSCIERIQEKINNLNISLVLCHGDACATTNFLRLSDNSIRIIDWEQAGMADPILDIAIATLHQGFKNVDPVWCLHHYFKRTPEKQEYFRLFSFLALNSYALMAWCIYENPDDYKYYLDSATKYSELILEHYL